MVGWGDGESHLVLYYIVFSLIFLFFFLPLHMYSLVKNIWGGTIWKAVRVFFLGGWRGEEPNWDPS